MKRSRTVAIAVGALAGLVLVTLIVVPVFFRGKVAELVRDAVNEAVEAEVEWQGVGLSLVRSFPNPSLRIDGLTVTGIEPFAGETLASVDRIQVVVSLPSVWRNWRHDEPVVVRSVDIDRPVLRLIRLEDGTANWEIMGEPAEPSPDDAADVAVSLRRFTIRDGALELDDRETGLFASVAGLEQTLEGDFTQDLFVLRTRALADEVSVRFAGLPYLSRARLEAQADLDADMVQQRFTFRENEVRLNELLLAFSGFAQVGDEDVEFDLTFGAPRTEFRHILSLVPTVYAADFASLETSGTLALSGRVQGRYGPNAFPAFALNASVEEGAFRYPDLPLPARDIAMELSVENPGGDLDNTVVDLSRFHVVIGDEPIDAALALRTPVSDPDVDFRFAGRLNLADLGRTMKLEGVDELAGVVSADAAVRARLSDVHAGRYDRVAARGGVEVANIALRAADLPHPLYVDEAALSLSPEHAELTSFRARIGASDLRGSGYLDNLLGYALRNEELRGRATLESSRFDLNDWRSDVEEREVVPVPPNVDFALQTTVDELVYGVLEMRDARGSLHVANQRVTLEDFVVRVVGGEVGVTGYYETTNPARPTFEVGLQMRALDIPSAFREFVTVQTLAPVAGYAQGNFSTDLQLSGALGPDMMPEFTSLNGRGLLETSRLLLEGFPALARAADAVRIPQLGSPTLDPLRTSFSIGDGRLHVSPFDVRLGDLRLNVAGSNGIDQTLAYDLRLEAPRALLGREAEQVVAGLLTRAGRAGVELQTADVIEIGIQLGGTVTNPSISTDIGRLLASGRDAAEQAVRDEATRRLGDLERQADEAAEAARAEAAERLARELETARAEAERIVREAEARAATIREEARELAETVRQEGAAAADSVLARATTPVARAAARPAADRMRQEADRRADQIIREADEQADRIVREAEQRAEQIVAAARREPDGPQQD